jgi:hypothetical protein
VNLSPYEKDRVVTDELGQTVLGETLLAQDYLLKQLSSSMTEPSTDLGKLYWNSVGANNYSPVQGAEAESLKKIWIKPALAEVFEKGEQVFVTKATLDVETEADRDSVGAQHAAPATNVLLPAIRKEVNEGEHFAPIRQAYSSIILGLWFKEKLKSSVYKSYIDQKHVSGIAEAAPQSKEEIFNAYVESFKKGVYNQTAKTHENGKIVKKAYFSGGFSASSAVVTKSEDSSAIGLDKNAVYRFGVQVHSAGSAILAPLFDSSKFTRIDEAWFAAAQNKPAYVAFRAAMDRADFVNDEAVLEPFDLRVRRFEEVKAKKDKAYVYVLGKEDALRLHNVYVNGLADLPVASFDAERDVGLDRKVFSQTGDEHIYDALMNVVKGGGYELYDRQGLHTYSFPDSAGVMRNISFFRYWKNGSLRYGYPREQSGAFDLLVAKLSVTADRRKGAIKSQKPAEKNAPDDPDYFTFSQDEYIRIASEFNNLKWGIKKRNDFEKLVKTLTFENGVATYDGIDIVRFKTRGAGVVSYGLYRNPGALRQFDAMLERLIERKSTSSAVGGVDLQDMTVSSDAGSSVVEFDVAGVDVAVFENGIRFTVTSLEKVPTESVLASLR